MMKVLITGGTGLIGKQLTRALRTRGDEVVIASRSTTGDQHVQWTPLEPGSLELPENTDAVVHLAGAPVFGQRWTEEYKKTIRESRVKGTRTVVRAIEESESDVKSFISGSAVGYYGDRDVYGSLTENADPADDFLAGVCVEAEQEAQKISNGPKPALIRTGIVLSLEGGALKRMLNPFPGIWPFHWGLGGPLGNGNHYMSWIHIKDEINAILHLLDNQLSGPFNLTAPEPVLNKKFTKALGQTLNRPAILPLPYFMMYLLYGEAAGMLYHSQRVLPQRLEESGFEFQYPTIREALEDLLA